MRMGTTPTISCKLDIDMDLTDCENVRLIISQNRMTKLIKDKDELIIKKNIVQAHLTQEETFLFAHGGADIQVRLKLLDGEAYATNIKRIDIFRSLDKEVI